MRGTQRGATPSTWWTATSWGGWSASTCRRRSRSGRSENKNPGGQPVRATRRDPTTQRLLVVRQDLEPGRLPVLAGIERERLRGAVLERNRVRASRKRRVVRAGRGDEG